ncbi:MAG: DUF3810 domain-containing protein [Oscillospiraceae bacterium]|nr:DUF3810 domain-containing protein [Oscillospiraceae bacterium]
MRQFFKHHKALHLWLIIAGGVVVLFHLLKYVRPVMNFWVDHIGVPLTQGFAVVASLAPFSVAEFFALFVVLGVIALLIREIRRILRKKSMVHGMYRIVAGFLAIVLSIYGSFNLLYGANFYADDFQVRSGIHARGATVYDLYRVTALFAQGLNDTAHLVERDENDVFAVSIDQIFLESVGVFRNLETQFPFLSHRDVPPKPLLISRLMRYTDYVGFFFPFTGEANINILAPRSQVPVTVAHEMVHQRGIASEDEANFVAILAGVKSENPVFSYSAYLMGYSYLANALRRVAPERFQEIHATLSDLVLADLADIRAYHDRKNPVAVQVTNAINDNFLRSYGEESGIQSYGEVVDLLIVFF